MHTELVKVPRDEAAALLRKYKEHAAYSTPMDWEIQRTYDLLAKGKVIIRAIESIKQAGLNTEFLPKLAIAPATATHCRLDRYANGSAKMNAVFPKRRWPKETLAFLDNTFVFPKDSFPLTWDGKWRREADQHNAALPLIPIHLRPKRGLQNYHILWEAEWQRVPPTDPYLLRRIGKSDLWLVCAHWDLTEVERAVLATRV